MGLARRHQHTDAEVTAHRPDEITQEAVWRERKTGGGSWDIPKVTQEDGLVGPGWGCLAGEVRPDPWGVHGLDPWQPPTAALLSLARK